MSKEIEWGEMHGCGDILCTCDGCGDEEAIPFEDGPDFRSAQNELKAMGWRSTQIQGDWHDFCCEDCRNDYIRNNT